MNKDTRERRYTTLTDGHSKISVILSKCTYKQTITNKRLYRSSAECAVSTTYHFDTTIADIIKLQTSNYHNDVFA